MFFGGWLYPDGVSAGLAAGAAIFEEDAADWAAIGAGAAQARTAPTKRHLKVFRTGMNDLRFKRQNCN
jgi:hypothetical protein